MTDFDLLLDDIRACRLCAERPDGDPLPHEPRPVLRGRESARIIIAGQAPGTRVHNSGVPFDDPSGERLRSWMGIGKEIFYDESRIAILPMGFCFPGLDAKGSDLPPRRECAKKWRAPLFEQFQEAELLLVIGQYAQKWHLGAARRKNLTETVAAWRDFAGDGAPTVLPLPHPSWRNNVWLKKNPWFEAELVPHLQARIAALCKATQ